MNRFTRLLILTVFTALFSFNAIAQIGGDGTYSFLNLSNSARASALGGNFVAIDDNDITLSVTNPSIISPEMDNRIALSFVDYYADINYGFASYSKTFSKYGSFVASVQFINYGEFIYTNNLGEEEGTFTANENAIMIGWGRALDSTFSIGANVKFISSFMESYSSYGIAVDIAGTYNNPDRQLTASLVFRNIGRQIKNYNPGVNESLPFEIQFGVSKRLKHLPFRYSLLLTNLQTFDLTYIDPNDVANQPDPFTGEVPDNTDNFGKKVLRHVVIGGEFIPTKNFSVRLGYNYRRRQEMKVDSKMGTVGFSWGVGFRISKFQFNYSRAAYHLVGSPNYITITTNLNSF
ncbi:MAG: type IX secretion system protein PorQ [Bacteroidota bacterium]|nr:type IX secretion system protein PorQ [Bacteroidota bacterium]